MARPYFGHIKMDNDKPTRAQGGIVPIRQRLALDVGQFVQHEGLTYRIVQQIDFNSLLGSDVITGRKKLLPIHELSSPPNPQVAKLDPRIDLDGIEDKDWRAANERFEAIKPLLDQAPSIGREEVNKRG